eukprot:13178339-Heterocapsa_arctica.AAC.1
MQWTAGRGRQFDDHSMHSTYLETSRRTGETIIGTDEGALWARTVRKMPEDKRWSKDAVSNLKGTSRAPASDDEEKLIGVRIDLPAGEERQGPLPPMLDGRAAAQRVYLRKTDLKKHGVARGCQGCDAPCCGNASSLLHKERCRERVEKEMGATTEEASRVDRAARRRSDTDADRRGKRFKLAEEVPKSDAAAAAVAAKGEGGPEADSA